MAKEKQNFVMTDNDMYREMHAAFVEHKMGKPDHVMVELEAERGQLARLLAGFTLIMVAAAVTALLLTACVPHRPQHMPPVPEELTDPGADDRSFVADAAFWIPVPEPEPAPCGCACDESA